MSVLLIMLPLALILATSAVIAFILAVRGGQFDDLDSPAVRMIVEEDAPTASDPSETGETSRALRDCATRDPDDITCTDRR